VRLELSFTSEGNATTFSDIALTDVTYTYIAEGEDLEVALDRVRNLTALLAAWENIQREGLVVGGPAALREVNAYLSLFFAP
jgi:hypothetical protein